MLVEFNKKKNQERRVNPNNLFLPKFFDAYMPQIGNKYGAHLPSISQWTKWANTNTMMMGAGDTIYRGEWRNFTVKEVRQILSSYIIHGLAPTPRLDYTFYPQSHD